MTPVPPRLDANDLELLRAFEPVVRFTHGESFLPMSVATYLAQAVRVQVDRTGTEHRVGEAGTLTAASVGAATAGAGGDVVREYLTVAGTAERADVADLLRGGQQAVGFRHRGGRLARVGYTARLVDALFSLSLLARGRVPGSLARASVKRYRAMVANDAAYPYYGRVVRTSTWTVLQYWFFYAFNDWRSGFNGANDHEADWEQVLVYLDAAPDGRAHPVWAAYAQHDYHGRDLRRRWDDAGELDLVDGHPVVYAGAGSHASYFRPGEYLAEQELKLPRMLRRVVNGLSRLVSSQRAGHDERILAIAFVDYARGDGVAIGPGCDLAWDPVLLDEEQRWVTEYRGLWGLSVQDPFQGEDAPAGPMFNRDGSVRRSWSDPVAFAELDIVPPPSRVTGLLDEQRATTERRQGEIEELLPGLERELAVAGAKQAASAPPGPEIELLRERLAVLTAERERNRLRLVDLERHGGRGAGVPTTSPRAHLRRVPVPNAPGADRASLLLETWAAVSVGLLLLALVGALLFAPRYGVLAAAAVIAVFVFVESLLRSRVVDLVALWVRILALVAAVVLAVTFWQAAVIGAAVAAGLFLLRENLAELLQAASPRAEAPPDR
jgi:hypothetical protein